MRRTLAPAVVAVAVLVIGCQSSSNSGQDASPSSPSTTADGASAEQAINRVLEEYRVALMKRDYATLERIWSDDLTFVNPRGQLLTKAQRLENLRRGATEFKSIDAEPARVRAYGEAAIAVSRVKVEAKYSGEEGSGTYYVTTGWARPKGQWQMVAVHMTRTGS